MSKLNRNAFLKMGALAMLTPLAGSFLTRSYAKGGGYNDLPADDLLKRLVAANDKQVDALLDSIKSDAIKFSRRIGSDISCMAAAYVSPASIHFHSRLVVSKLDLLMQVLERVQTADGTVNIGNLESPPDTAFLIELLTAGAHILIKDNSVALADFNRRLKGFMVRSGEALATGGVHTPNHRWVISAALARLNELYPNKKYVDRIEDWLGEGVFIDSDGHYPERSIIYAGVEDAAFITMARLLNRPALFEPVRKNLNMLYYYLEPNGDLVTTDSRRQDQYMTKDILPFYLHYRYMAIRDNNSHFAAITKYIEGLKGFEQAVVSRGLFHFLENPALLQDLPASSALPENYEKLFDTTQLLRIRRGQTTATLFGGVDWPIIIASGRSNSPNFFAFRKGQAILKHARLSSGFFSMGYFYSEGMKKEGNGYTLHKKLEVPYYQPLPKNLRKHNGDYTLSPSIDDRFWNKMDFSNRPVSNVKTLETTVSLVETNGAVELTFSVHGLNGVPVAIELCFDGKGKLSGVTTTETGDHFLESGYGAYEYEGDTIKFGPGKVTAMEIGPLEGERYSTHFGTLKTDGQRVFLTGVTPFSHVLSFS